VYEGGEKGGRGSLHSPLISTFPSEYSALS
jgi:hypothetical protein